MPRWNSSIDSESVGVPESEVEAKLNELAQQHGASLVSAEQQGTTWRVTFEGGDEVQALFTQLGASGVEQLGDAGTTSGADTS